MGEGRQQSAECLKEGEMAAAAVVGAAGIQNRNVIAALSPAAPRRPPSSPGESG